MRIVRTSLALAAAGAILALSGCFFDGVQRVESTPTGEQVPATVAPYYHQVLTWTDCGSGMQCATALAPMDWTNPSPQTDIGLALVRHPASGTARGSLFVNPGGPGASGFDLVHDDVSFAVSPALEENFDVIGWDPRGVGRSAPVACYEPGELDDYLFARTAPPAEDSPERVDELTQSAVDFGQACLDKTGPVLQFVDTVSTVHDLDMLRAAVGDAKLSYLGYSYGSDIGSLFIEDHPERAGRIVLDGATDSTLSSFEIGLVQARGFERALVNYVTACPTLFADCPFQDGPDAALARIRGLVDRLDTTPIAAPDGRLLDAGVLDTAISEALYSQDSWPLLNDMFREVEADGTGTAFDLADYYYGRNPDGSFADNSQEAFTAISCLDYPVETDPEVLVEQEQQYRTAAPTTYIPSPPVGDLTCANWPFHYRGPVQGQLTGTGAPDILIVSTTGDPATPYEWGVALSQQLASAHLISFEGEGHTAYNKGNACVDSAVDDYFVSGVVPTADPRC